MHHPIDRIVHITAFVTTVIEHWLEREIARWVHHEASHHERMFYDGATCRASSFTGGTEFSSISQSVVKRAESAQAVIAHVCRGR